MPFALLDAGPGTEGRRAAEAKGARGGAGRGAHARADPGSPALSAAPHAGGSGPPRPANCKLQAFVIGSRGVRRTRRVECFADTSVGVDLKLKTVELRGKKIRL